MEYREAHKILSENPLETPLPHEAEIPFRKQVAHCANAEGVLPPDVIALGVNNAVQAYYDQRGANIDAQAAISLGLRGLFEQIFTPAVLDVLTEIHTIAPPPMSNQEPSSNS